MKVFLKNRLININPSSSIGKGGEADIYDIGNGLVLKIFKNTFHPDLKGFPQEQIAAKYRLKEHQRKLPSFPKLPKSVISPIDLVTDSKKYILGYSMKFLKGYDLLLKYSDRKFRNSIENQFVLDTFKDLYKTVIGIHNANVIIGDFNDLNILVSNRKAYIIDADSFQFDNFYCNVFTEKFVDPLLCNQNDNFPILNSHYNFNSDWYAFSIMLMQSFLFVGPYGGVYIPKDKNKRVNHATRPLKRITIFNKDVRYPKPAIHYNILDDDLLQYFHLLFEEDKRGTFPEKLLDMRWTKCCNCGTTHARNICPNCSKYVKIIKETVRGNVSCTNIFKTSGLILYSKFSNKLEFLYYNNNSFIREDGSVIANGNLNPTMRFRIRGKETLIGNKEQFISFKTGNISEKTVVDSLNLLPLFDTNNTHKYWVYDGMLMRDDIYGNKYLGDVLRNQSLFWVGEEFGFGFYRAGALSVAFLFDVLRPGINDSIDLDLNGHIIDATCYFAGNWCWFLLSVREGARTINKCMIIKNDGKIYESFKTVDGDGSWLGNIRGKCAAGKFLLSATDNGIVRVEPNNGSLEVVKEFLNSEPFVDSSSHLLPSNNGLYVISRKEINLLKIS